MLFFFFKQKTAYEIYQCDWSSDVCSSDLPAGGRVEGTCIEAAPDLAGRVAVRGVTPGIGRLILDRTGWSAFVRVSRRDYVGRNKYRHLEEIDDE